METYCLRCKKQAIANIVVKQKSRCANCMSNKSGFKNSFIKKLKYADGLLKVKKKKELKNKERTEKFMQAGYTNYHNDKNDIDKACF